MEFLVVLHCIVTPSYVHISLMSVLVLMAMMHAPNGLFMHVVINTAVAFIVCNCVSEGSHGFQERKKQAPSGPAHLEEEAGQKRQLLSSEHSQ